MAAQKKKDIIVDDGAVYVLRPGTPVYMKTADICAMTGKSNQWIGQLVSQGTINKRSTPHGALFDVSATIRAYCEMICERVKTSNKSTEALEKEKQEAEIRIKNGKATIMDFEVKEIQGKMHRSEDVLAITEDLIFAIRGMLMALPGRLAVDVSNTKTAAEASETIRKEVYKIMEELSQYHYDPAKYEERVRERMSWDIEKGGQDGDDEG